MVLRIGIVAAVALGAAGCTFIDGETCARGQDSEGVCCPAWSFAADGRCEARTWLLPTTADGVGEEASRPSLDIDRQNRVWLTFEQGYYDGSAVVLAREAEQGWELQSPSLALGAYHYDARVAAVDDQHAVLVWERSGEGGDTSNEVRVGVGGGVLLPPPSGGTFSFPPYALQHKVQAHADGELVVVWNQAMDEGLRRGVCIAVRQEGDADFARPQTPDDVLSRSIIFANNPELSRNERGDTVVTWYESIGDKLRVLASERDGLHGSFSHPRDEDALSPPEGDVEDPAPAVAEDGRAAIVWRQVLPDGRMAVFLSERSSEGAWSRPAIDESFSGTVDLAWNTRIAYARTGDLYVAWEQKVGDDWSVMLAHRDASGRWIASGRDPMRLSANRGIEPVLRVAPDGAVVVLWRARMGSRWRILTRRSSVDTEGAREVDRWSPALALSGDGGDAASPTLAVARDATSRGHRFVAAWAQDGRIWTASLD